MKKPTYMEMVKDLLHRVSMLEKRQTETEKELLKITPETSDKILGYKEIAQYMGVSYDHVVRTVKNMAGFPKPIKPSKRPKFYASEVIKFLKKQGEDNA
ncbi:helix-turn-helix transcriptional regulator [Phocoenobacter skyensis]|uniref:Helix-turn-helix domain-containing protein n=1 Tax=Phocoenobacter skyensis TaxID=97481 RepID=A0ABT9JKD4_9PAST|nr:hypothetical protein [Pasteurella skyensis]MDP8078399.1 hypothetical protein [Pasteurella skyensis]MDP8084509.1 hypothetical protein [Pasteurella skyensis]